MKVFYAHGFVVRDVERVAGSQDWKRDSAFGEVFFDFESAKDYLVNRFDRLSHEICKADVFAREDGKLIIDSENKEQYIDDHIYYKLIVSELNSEDKELRIEWYFRYDGTDLSRYFVYPDKRIEYRVEDVLPLSGTKYHPGDIVTYCGAPTGYYDETVFIVLSPPPLPIDRMRPWENHYRLLELDLPTYYYGGQYFRVDTLHESDIKPFSKELLDKLNKDGIMDVLTPIITLINEGKTDDKLLNDIIMASGKKIHVKGDRGGNNGLL